MKYIYSLKNIIHLPQHGYIPRVWCLVESVRQRKKTNTVVFICMWKLKDKEIMKIKKDLGLQCMCC